MTEKEKEVATELVKIAKQISAWGKISDIVSNIAESESMADEFISQVSYLGEKMPEFRSASKKLAKAQWDVQDLLKNHFPDEDWKF